MSSNKRDEGRGKYFAIQLAVAAILIAPIFFFDVRGALPVGAAIAFYVVETIILTVVMFLPSAGLRIIRSKLAKWFLVGVISIPLGFLWSMFGYGYGVPTPGMYLTITYIPHPANQTWSNFDEIVFGGMAIDAVCVFLTIWVVYTLFRRRPTQSR